MSQKFMLYFRKGLKENLKTEVNEPVRKTMISREWTNNNCESINHVLKQAIDWKSKPLLELVGVLQDLTNGQYKDLRAALLGTGEFRLADGYRHFQITKTEWVSKTAEQKNKVYQKFRKYVPSDGKVVQSTDGSSEIVTPKTHGKKKLANVSQKSMNEPLLLKTQKNSELN